MSLIPSLSLAYLRTTIKKGAQNQGRNPIKNLENTPQIKKADKEYIALRADPIGLFLNFRRINVTMYSISSHIK
jgi:hypothetical protein